MKLIANIAFAALVSFGFASTTVSADDAAGKKACCADKAECAGGTCPVSAAMAKLPKMTFLVGTESTCCSQSAAALAKSSSEPIHFVVGDRKFESKDKAFAMLVSATENMVKEYTTPHTCSVSGKTTIAGTSSACSVTAGKLAAKVKEATSLVSMKYMVGEEACGCPVSGKAMAKKAGKPMTFVVGTEKTTCEKTARLNLARAKYEAAVKAMAQVEAPAKADSET